MKELVINQTKTVEGNNCILIKNVHVVKVECFYITTLTTIYPYSPSEISTKSSSFVYSSFDEAMMACNEYLG